MIAMSALGVGINVSGISIVIHVDQPYSCIQFNQEYDCGSREGETIYYIMLLKKDIIEGLI